MIPGRVVFTVHLQRFVFCDVQKIFKFIGGAGTPPLSLHRCARPDRSAEMLTPKNICPLLTCSENWRVVSQLNQFLGLLILSERLFLWCHSTMCSISTDSSSPMIWPTTVGEFVDGFGAVFSHTVKGVKRVEQRAKHRGLRCIFVDNEEQMLLLNLADLKSEPVPKGGTKGQVSELGDVVSEMASIVSLGKLKWIQVS